MFTSSWLWSNRARKVSLGGVPRLRYLRYLSLETPISILFSVLFSTLFTVHCTLYLSFGRGVWGGGGIRRGLICVCYNYTKHCRYRRSEEGFNNDERRGTFLQVSLGRCYIVMCVLGKTKAVGLARSWKARRMRYFWTCQSHGWQCLTRSWYSNPARKLPPTRRASNR